MNGFIYIMRPHDRPWAKVGWAIDPERRRIELQCGCPDELAIVLTFPGSLTEEGQYRALLSDGKVRGEWIEWTPHLDALVAELLPMSAPARAIFMRMYSLQCRVDFGVKLARIRASMSGASLRDEYRSLPAAYLNAPDELIQIMTPLSSAGDAA